MTTPTRNNIAKPLRQFAITVVISAIVIGSAIAIGRSSPRGDYHTPQWAVTLHLLTVIPALPLGAYILWSKKGDSLHRMLGKVWAVLMLVTSIDSFWIRETTGHIGPIHIFSVVTLISIPLAIYHIRKGNVAGHLRAMRGSFIGLCAAGTFAIMPGRTIGNWLFG
jgi:uncharacterized membrane protein